MIGFDTLRPWLFGEFLPFWLDRAPDPRHGGVLERLTLDGHPADVPQRRTMVQARLLYVFSHAAVLGAGERATDTASRIFGAMVRRHWDDRDGGWWHSVTVDGGPLDRRKDAYAHAFVLFATAWYFRATGAAEARAWADRTLAFLDARMTAPPDAGGWGGFVEEIAAPGDEARLLPRQQNPHMHFLEAMLAWREATSEPGWLERARAVLGLFERRFFDAGTGSLGEFFAADWTPAPGAAGRLREPGHHYEWTWLLHQYHRLTGDASVLPAARALYDFAQAHGLAHPPDAPSVVIDQVDRTGTVINAGRRLWPQTEALKAALARFELWGAQADHAEARHRLTALFTHHLSAHPLWCEQQDAQGHNVSAFLPLSSLYHVQLAVAELMRIMEVTDPPTSL